MYHIDPVTDAERVIERMAKAAEEAAEISRGIEIRVRAEAAFLEKKMMDVLQNGSPKSEIPTFSVLRKKDQVSEFLPFLAESDHAEKLFDLIQDAAKGKKVQDQAKVLQEMFAKSYGDVYAEASLKAKGQL